MVLALSGVISASLVDQLPFYGKHRTSNFRADG